MSLDSWWDQAACGFNPEVFYSTEEGDLGTARAICKLCEVRSECWEQTIADEAGRARADLHGFRAGLTAPKRHKLLGRMCPNCRGVRNRTNYRYCSDCAHLESPRPYTARSE